MKDFDLVQPNIAHDSGDPALAEYILRVTWVNAVPREDAKWQQRSGLYSTQLIRASLEGQPQTVGFIEDPFAVKLRDLAD